MNNVNLESKMSTKSSMLKYLLTYAVLSESSGKALLIAYGGLNKSSPVSCLFSSTSRLQSDPEAALLASKSPVTVLESFDGRGHGSPKIGAFGSGAGVVRFGGSPF